MHIKVVRPLFEYAPEVWNPYLRSAVNKIEKCQNTLQKLFYLNAVCLRFLIKKG